MHRFITIKGINLIKSFESFSARPYKCPGGYFTIGYGHLIRPGEYFTEITHQEGEEILKRDLRISERQVMRNIRIELNQNEFDSLVSFTFNLGGAALQRSTLRQKINKLEYDNIEYEFMRWVYARGIKLLGLERRRKAEADLFLNRI